MNTLEAVTHPTATTRPTTLRGPARRSIGGGLLVLLITALAAAAVLPVPRWDLWLLGVLALLGLAIVLIVMALLPRPAPAATLSPIGTDPAITGEPREEQPAPPRAESAQ